MLLIKWPAVITRGLAIVRENFEVNHPMPLYPSTPLLLAGTKIQGQQSK